MNKLKVLITVIAIVSILSCATVVSAIDTTEPATEQPTVNATEPATKQPTINTTEPAQKDVAYMLMFCIGSITGCLFAQAFSFWKW
ncbi:unknown [Clostridium sp. CAG:964]|jgi:hypothetical protein|nr:unknown [Clostridium sp. CAG:964]